MFESIGWLEIFTLLVVALIVVGPERLPGLIEDIRAAIFAARRAINNAKKELNGELGSEFEELRKPFEQVASYTRLGPRAAITKALFDGDDEFLDDFDPKKMMQEDPRRPAPRPSAHPVAKPADPQQPPNDEGEAGRGGFSWADIT
ncbi:Sec-independent protein translocase protein TatB [Corynebacterium atrinae]|uniref:Sec-independent protein translocase protein TatB n=1 Tax=Corynebacterium atrinae TaxID=1336740 RepID=UPI0025B386DA|nr:Sec-independent protein translocase protein TatB [Corynebacterium atrinae]WJY63060.1 Sec-independent protein translocase protein TatB [Corynebacterium atrinae]